jgi:hypothetical protein
MREWRSSSGFVLERRRTPRFPLRVEVSCSFEGAVHRGSTDNLTVYGCLLRTDEIAPVGTEVALALDLQDAGPPARATGRVVRVARRGEEVLGFAVEFEPLDEAAEGRIAALVEQARIDLMAPQEGS